MADDELKTPEVLIGGHVSDQPAFGAYSARTGSSFARDISKKTPYALLEKTGQLPEKATPSVMDKNNRWLRELGITSTDLGDFQKAWETDNTRKRKSEHEWRDSYGGKLAIRTFSRGIMGSVFFAAGQHMAVKYLGNYSYDPTNAARNSVVRNPLEFVARLFDKTLGKGIYKAALVLNKGDTAKAANVVTFRHTNHWSSYGNHIVDGKQIERKGRSYGHEGLAITFDFGLASLGDYFGREIAGLLDPNTEKKWMKDGKMDIPQATKALLKSVWVGTSKAMGEDYFAMAAGYPYVVRGTRNMIDKFSPGFKHDSDRWGNGGSFKVNDKGEITGNYQLEGMADLGLRFSAYNMFTKMYRDGYDKVAVKVKHFWDGDRAIHMPHFETPPTPVNIIKQTADGIGNFAKYVTRTIVKMGIIMIPSSSVFAFIRAAQSKDTGLAINPNKGPVGVIKTDEHDGKKYWAPIYTDGTVKNGKRSAFHLTRETPYLYADGSKAEFGSFAPDKTIGFERRFDPYGVVTEQTKWHDRFTNPVGRFCHDAGSTLAEAVKPVYKAMGGKMSGSELARHTQRYADATLAYTPYFMAKTDLLSTAYDTPRMDMSIDRAIDGVTHLKFGEFKAGTSEMLHTIMNRPFNDPDREKLAQKKMQTYTNQLWSSQDEIIAKDREVEYQERMDAMLSLGKPMTMQELYRTPFTEKVKRSRENAANEPYYAQNITPMTPKKPEDYKKPEEQGWKKQANSSWHERTLQEFGKETSSQGQTIN